MRLNLFWKLGFAFFALLIAVLLPVDYYAERTLRSDYERAGFDQLSAIARIALATPPPASSLSTTSHTASPALAEWVTRMAASGVRVTVITADGVVLADSQSDPQTMENHAGRPEIRDALAKGRLKGHEALPAKMTLAVGAVGLTFEIDGAIELE